MGAETANILANFDFTMFGLFLGDQPTLRPEGKPLGLYFALLLIPILSGATSMIMSLSTMKSTPAMDSQAAGMSKSMMIMMPLMSVWISFIVPAGVGIYWLISNILSSIQTIILNRIMNPAEEIAKAEAAEKERLEKERVERIEAKKLAKETSAVSTGASLDGKALSQKEVNRRKLAEARRRDAERYGEEYVDVTDDDIK
jgi:YidC/Oxa1 family membrane protein insertase